MPMVRALRLCPQLIIVSSRHRAYGEVSKQVMARLNKLTPLVEQISIDEAFLDISDINEAPERLARRLQAGIRDELDLPCSIGIASNKLVAKIATEVGKKGAKRRKAALRIDDCSRGRRSRIPRSLARRDVMGCGAEDLGTIE